MAAVQIATPSLAQVASDSATAPQAVETSDAGDIIVTATRREQNLQDVPGAVNVVGEAQVKALALLGTRDLVPLVPSLTFSQGSISKLYNFTIRRIGSYVTSDAFERQDGFSTVNLAAGFGSEDGSWQLSAYGSNVFDKAFIARTIPQNAGSYYSQVVPYDANARFGVAREVSFG